MLAAIQDRAVLRRLVVLTAALSSAVLASACATVASAAPALVAGAAPGPVAQAAMRVAAVPTPAEADLTAIRVARHPAYDRVVFQFAGTVPGYTFRYVKGVNADGSGRPVPLPGRAYLQVVFNPASAQRSPGTLTPLLPTLLQVKPAGDFEGYLSFGIGLSGRARVHAFTLAGPDRVVLDIVHVRLPKFPGIWDITSWRRYWAAQSSVEEGHQPWLLRPSAVVRAWAAGWASHAVVRQTGPNTFEVRKPGTSQKALVTGTRPVHTGPAPIWVISHVTYIG
jgi:hypothetical protein